MNPVGAPLVGAQIARTQIIGTKIVDTKINTLIDENVHSNQTGQPSQTGQPQGIAPTGIIGAFNLY